MTECLSDDEIGGFVAGWLSQAGAQQVAAHIDGCAACRRLVAAAATETAGAVTEPEQAAEAPLVPAPAVGDRVGRFVVLSALGRGGMGAVFGAYDPDLDRKVALKLVRPGSAGVELQARLLREAQAMARLHHPEVITVYEVGTYGDQIFIAMELVDGGTLRQWLGVEPRHWRDVVSRFARAGDGLQAAHDVGMVHRDFKADNVLVGRDGRQRVTDFGLARAVSDCTETTAPTTSISPASPLGAAITTTGALIGTPVYMAPEQLAGEPIDARADQFSFCASLYQALYDELPFAGHDAVTLREAIAHERLRPPRAGARVPAGVRAVLQRGLKADRGERYPSMAALVVALRRRTQRRWAPALVASGVLVALIAGAGGQALLARRHPRCAGDERLLAGVWDAARRQRAHAAFARSGLPFAATVWTTVTAALDDYAQQAMTADGDACTAALSPQPPATTELRAACIHDRLGELRALVDLLADADAALVARAPQAVAGLPPFEACRDVPLLAQGWVPRDRRQSDEGRALRAELGRTHALVRTGKLAEARQALDRLIPAAEAAKQTLVAANLLHERGILQLEAGQLSAAEASFQVAAARALQAHDDEQAELSWNQLSTLVSISEGQPAQGLVWASYAEAAELRRDGHDATSRDRLDSQAQLFLQRGQFDAAEANLRRALQIVATLPANGIATMQAESNLAVLLCNEWRLDEAAPVLRRVLASHEKLLGRDHPETVTARENLVALLNLLGRAAEALPLAELGLAERIAVGGERNADAAQARYNLALALAGAGRYDEALAQHRRALAVLEPLLGRDNVVLSDYYTDYGVALTQAGQAQAALTPLERALALRLSAHGQPLELAPTQFALAQALVATHGDRRRALALAQAARAAHVEAARRWHGNNEARAALIQAWIDAA